MKRIISISLAVLISALSFAENSEEVASAIQWLEIVDSGDYEQSWEQSAPFFQSQISNADWVQALNQVRAPLGHATSRALNSAHAHASLPGVPDGEYVVITLVTDFEKKSTAIETITVSKVSDAWLPVGYFIK